LKTAWFQPLRRLCSSDILVSSLCFFKWGNLYRRYTEGITHNGQSVMKFQTGAFALSRPVLPILLRYPYRHFNPAGLAHFSSRYCAVKTRFNR
jgi:hypothetical protein